MKKRRHSSYYDDYWPSYESTRPIAVEDGIKAQSKRGSFVKNWWADRWIAALTRLMDAGRLSRGRSYARRGQVLEINVTSGAVAARVQGSQRTPYKVKIELQPLATVEWRRVLAAMAEQAIFAAQLLNGEMPPDIEQIFAAVDVPLFPDSRDDLKTHCSCPDPANPCKHIAAVYYLLGEQFDQDPFLLLMLRGMAKEDIIRELRARRAAGAPTAEANAPAAPDELAAVAAPPLGEAPERYWDLGPQIDGMALRIEPPIVEMALFKRLGVPDFLDARTLWAQLQRVYAGVAERAVEMAFADVDDTRPDDPAPGA